MRGDNIPVSKLQISTEKTSINKTACEPQCMCVVDKVLTARYSMVYIENEACPEKKDFLQMKQKVLLKTQIFICEIRPAFLAQT